MEGSAIYKGRRISGSQSLSTELFLELQVWLKTQPSVGIIALQETHWSIQGEWQSGDWYLVHSPAPKPKQGGVLLGIRKDLLTSTHYSWNELVPGRLLHWRGCIGKQTCDIFNLYQHALAHKTEEQKQLIMKNRRGVWQQLDRALSAFLFRTSRRFRGATKLSFLFS
ncbi:Pol [Symbiodinium sp. CCMP2592]|nr:Pol [Symbiodinium sp. CCMP2592]